MLSLYPFKFIPIFKDKIWGGSRVHDTLGLDYAPLLNCGEAWMVSGIQDNSSVIANGYFSENELNEIVETFMGDLVGEKVYEKFGNEFPVLIKFIDTQDYLSIQVHPDDELAARRHHAFGKAEMWYIIDTVPGAELICGFSQKISPEMYKQHLINKSLPEILNFEKVKTGDVFFIPAGRVHALGPGILLTEIQQTSDVTYRIYDWDRTDDKGKPRTLHTDLALDAIDFNVYDTYKIPYVEKNNQTVPLINSPHFTTGILHLKNVIAKDYSEIDSFVIYICTEGALQLVWDGGNETMKKGEVILIPAIVKNVTLIPSIESKILEVYIE